MRKRRYLAAVLAAMLLFTGCADVVHLRCMTADSNTLEGGTEAVEEDTYADPQVTSNDFSEIITENMEFITELDGNIPEFSASVQEWLYDAGVIYGGLDDYGRSTGIYAYLSADRLQKSEKIGADVTTSGLHTVYYDTIVQTDGTKGAYLFRRCHLLKSALGGAKDDARNFFTGTYDMNYRGMNIYEQQVIHYLKETGNHVLYQVTPVYTGENLIPDGVVMQGYSEEDDGAGICFHVYIQNIQPGIHINYENGFSYLERNE